MNIRTLAAATYTANPLPGDTVEGWVLMLADGCRDWLEGISQRGAFIEAERRNAVWAREYANRNGAAVIYA